MLSLEILMMIISSILFVSNDSVISENKLMLTILLLQECGMTREENLAIASTAVNTAKYKNLTIKQLLQDGESHWIYNQRVLKRISEYSIKDIRYKYSYAETALKNPMRYTHYLRSNEKPFWRKRVNWAKRIGKHQFGYSYYVNNRWRKR